MTGSYPQETVGITLFEDYAIDERRRVFMRHHMNRLEVGEFTRGNLTEGIYGEQTHFHCLHLDDEAQRLCAARLALEVSDGDEGALGAFLHNYFDASRTLADLMDELDRLGVAYGYLNVRDGGHIRYRPPSRMPLMGYAV